MPLALLQSTLKPLQPMALRVPTLVVPKLAAAPSEYDADPQSRQLRQTPYEQSYVDKLIQAPLSALGYVGSQLDAILGRRVRAGISLVQGNRRPGLVSELFTVPIVSDLVGWTDRRNTATGKELTGWDDDDTILDGVAGFAVEMLTDPLTFLPGALIGALNKGGRIVRGANPSFWRKVSVGLSKQQDRRVGVLEAKTIATLKDALDFTEGVTSPSALSPASRKAWDLSAKGQGYKDFDEAFNALGDRVLGGRFGLTWNPIGEARWTFGTGKLALKSLQVLDTANGYLKASRVGTTIGKLFDARARNADTAELQKRFRDSADDFRRETYAVRLKNFERHADLTMLGLDDPKFRDAILGSVEKAVKRSQKTGQKDWYLHPDERHFDRIIGHNLKRAGHTAAAVPQQWHGYKPFKEFLEGVWMETAEDLKAFEELGLGNKALQDTRTAYFHRATQPIVDPKWYTLKPPVRITKDIRRTLRKKGLVDSDIDKLTPDEALTQAYGKKIARASKLRAEQMKRSDIGGGSMGTGDKVVANSDKTEIGRLPFLSNIREGTPWLADAVMDTRLSGPLAQYAKNRPLRAKIVLREAFQTDPKHLEAVEASAAKRMSHPQFAGVENAPFQPGQTWDDLAGAGEVGAGKVATDVLTPRQARKLNDWLTIERGNFEQSGQLADWLVGLDPRHAFHQVPLFKNDPALLQMEFGLATARTKQMAKVGLKMAGDALDSKLDTHELGPTILQALKGSGYEAKGKDRLVAFLRQNVGEYGQDAAFSARARRDLNLLTTDNPHAKFLTPTQIAKGAKGMKVHTAKGEQIIDPKWFKHEVDQATVGFQYGLSGPKLSQRKGGQQIYDLFKARAEKRAAAQGAKIPGTPLHLREEDYVDLLRQAETASIKVAPKTARHAAMQVAYDRFTAAGGKPFRIRNDAAVDLAKHMTFTRDPDVVRGFLGVVDKITNFFKSALTAQQLAFGTRNIQTLGVLDFGYGAGAQGGVASMLAPKRVGRFLRRWKRSVEFHKGNEIRDAHSLPLFHGTDWNAAAKRYTDLTGKTHINDAAFRQRAANDALRNILASTQAIDAHRVGAPVADVLNVHPEAISAVAEMIPGQGRNVQSVGIGLADASKSLKDVLGKITTGRFRDVDWSFLNPFAVRGTYGPPHAMRSQYIRAKIGEAGNQYFENVGRTATWLGFVEEGMDPMEAAMRTNAMHVDYSDFTSFERKAMKRMVPFYSFTRRMTANFLRDLWRHPGGTTANLVRAVNNSSGEGRSDRPVPQQLVGQLAIPLYKNGDVQAYLRPDVPVNVLNNLFTVGPDAYSTFQNTVLGWLGQAHFIPKFMLETAFGKSTFQKGRNLEDLYSRIGVKDPLTNQIIMSLPLSRDITQFGPHGVLFDERKSLLEKASSLIAGMPVQHINTEKATDELVSEAIRRSLRTAEGVGRAERFYAYDDEALDDRSKALLDLQNRRSREKSKRRREIDKSKEQAAKEQASTPGRFDLPQPTMLPMLGR